ncbi:MAG: hypothetical protein GF341_09790 [candidate division Zixibacteria bacterium]|nr:hypothetical protein [candidate division Zixibacteria bacterium]
MKRVRYIGALVILLLVVQLQPGMAGTLDIHRSAVITSSIVNMYAGLSTHSTILGQLKTGEAYDIIDHTQHWVRIEHPQFGEGWLETECVDVRPETLIVASALAANITRVRPPAYSPGEQPSGFYLEEIIAAVVILLFSLAVGIRWASDDEATA